MSGCIGLEQCRVEDNPTGGGGGGGGLSHVNVSTNVQYTLKTSENI